MSRAEDTLGQKVRTCATILLVLPLALPVVAVAIPVFLLYRATLYVLIWSLWVASGKDVFVVYSDSPIWREYMVNEIIPLVQERAVVLNWSERKKWARTSLAPYVFRSFAGRYEYNPMVIVFRPFRRAQSFRFWMAFKDWKRGYKEPVERLRHDLLLVL